MFGVSIDATQSQRTIQFNRNDHVGDSNTMQTIEATITNEILRLGRICSSLFFLCVVINIQKKKIISFEIGKKKFSFVLTK